MPALNRLKVKYYGDRETIGEEQNKLYKEQHYHPMLSLIPLAVQIIILFGLVDVIHTITDGGAPGTEFLGSDSLRGRRRGVGSCRLRGAFRHYHGLRAEPHQPAAARAVACGEEHDERPVHRPFVHLGRVRRHGHGLLLGVLEPDLHRHPGARERPGEACEIHRLRGPRGKPRRA